MLQLRYRVAFGSNLVHTAPFYSYTNQYTSAQMRVLGSLDNHAGASDFDESLGSVFLGLSSEITGLFTTSNPVETVQVTVPEFAPSIATVAALLSLAALRYAGAHASA